MATLLSRSAYTQNWLGFVRNGLSLTKIVLKSDFLAQIPNQCLKSINVPSPSQTGQNVKEFEF